MTDGPLSDLQIEEYLRAQTSNLIRGCKERGGATGDDLARITASLSALQLMEIAEHLANICGELEHLATIEVRDE